MPLKKPRPSRATTQAYRAGLKEMVRLGRCPANLPKEGTPQRIYILKLQDIAKGKGVRYAKPMFWEFLAGGPSGPSVLVAIGDPTKGKPPVMTSLGRDPVASDALQATAQVEKLPLVKAHKYELRRIRISALSLGAFWLKALQPGVEDLCVPYHAIHHEFKRMQAYPMDDFMSVLQPMAVKKLEAEAALRRKSRAPLK